MSYADITPPSKNPSAIVTENPNNGHVAKKVKHRNASSTSSETRLLQTGVAFEECRELTYEEIWDDSALIEAWNAATEEYEAFNGPDKSWKSEPVHKVPLYAQRLTNGHNMLTLTQMVQHPCIQNEKVRFPGNCVSNFCLC